MQLGLPQFPEWVAKLMAALLILGLLMIIVIIGASAVYIFDHLNWK